LTEKRGFLLGGSCFSDPLLREVQQPRGGTHCLIGWHATLYPLAVDLHTHATTMLIVEAAFCCVNIFICHGLVNKTPRFISTVRFVSFIDRNHPVFSVSVKSHTFPII
jgi:hypothetical protein